MTLKSRFILFLLLLVAVCSVVLLATRVLQRNSLSAETSVPQRQEQEVTTISGPSGRVAVDFLTSTYARPITLTVDEILSAPIIDQYSALYSFSVEAVYIEKPLTEMAEPFVIRMKVPPTITIPDVQTGVMTELAVHDSTVFKFVRGAGWVAQLSHFDPEKREVLLQSTKLGTYALAWPRELE